MTSVAVTRTPSADLLPMSLVNLVPGSLTLTCALSACDFSSLLPAGELIRVNGKWFKVSSDYAGSATSLPLALANDSSVKTAYTGLAANNVPLYRWARGYEWAVTFLSVTNMATAGTAAVMPLTSPKHGNQSFNQSHKYTSINVSQLIRHAHTNNDASLFVDLIFIRQA